MNRIFCIYFLQVILFTLIFLAFQQHHLNANLISQIKPEGGEDSEEIEVGDNESSLSEISDDNKRRRTRTNFTQWQINELEKAFRYFRIKYIEHITLTL